MFSEQRHRDVREDLYSFTKGPTLLQPLSLNHFNVLLWCITLDCPVNDTLLRETLHALSHDPFFYKDADI